MKVEIHRYDPVTEQKWVDTYQVPTHERSMTVMDVLDYICTKQDSTLAYYKHSVCNHGICARCAVWINGHVRLACTELVNSHDSLALAPIPNQTVIRDLVTVR